MNGTINLKKLSTKMLDAISTLNTDVSNLTTSIPSQIKTNNRQMLATVEQNTEASSRAYATGEYLAVNGKLYRALNDIAEGAALQENVNIEWVLLGDEVSKLRGDLKSAAFCTAVNNLDTVTPTGYVLDARVGPWIRNNINNLNTNTTSLQTRMAIMESKYYITWTGDINARDRLDGGTVYSRLNADTNYWVYFPVRVTGYQVRGVLGYYIHSDQGAYPKLTIYTVVPSTGEKGGVSMAFHVPSGTAMTNPRAAFTVLMDKI